MKFLYKHKDTLLAEIYVDYVKGTVRVVNYTDDIMDKPFGVNDNPTIDDFEYLLEDRCFPRDRDMMKLHLEELGILSYEPLEIIKKTKGKLEGDFYSLELVEE